MTTATAAVLSILPKPRGRRPSEDPIRLLKFFPWGHGGRQFIYALAFEGDVVKVGQTGSPRKRLSQHWKAAKGEVKWIHLFESMHQETASGVERRALNALRALGAEQINGSEWFFTKASRGDVIAAIRPLIAEAKAEVWARWERQEAEKRYIAQVTAVLKQHGLLPPA